MGTFNISKILLKTNSNINCTAVTESIIYFLILFKLVLAVSKHKTIILKILSWKKNSFVREVGFFLLEKHASSMK